MPTQLLIRRPRSAVRRRVALCCLAIAAALLGGAAPASAQAPNNNFAGAIPLVFGQTDNRFSNLGANAENAEALTSQNPGRATCNYANNQTSQANFTLWWTVVGTGRRITVSTGGSNFDTHLGIFQGTINESFLCFDSAGQEFVFWDSSPGQIYHVQVGDCQLTAPNPFNPACAANGNSAIAVTATSPAADNDNRSNAAVLPTGQIAAGDNFAASEEAGEPVDCASDRGQSPYGRTVWYRWTAPGTGTAVFTATGFDTVLAVLPAGSNSPLRCDDDPEQAGPSRIQIPVTAGEYVLQVAGFGRHAGFDDSAQGQFNIAAEFAAAPPPPPPPPPDSDGDGIPDSSDKCPTVKPTRDTDKDGCQDKPKRILAELKYRFNPYRRLGRVRGQALTRVRLIHVPTGARVRVTCARCQKADARGRTRKFRSFTLTVKRGGTAPVSRLNRVLLPRGGRLIVVVTRPTQLGRRIIVRVNRGAPIDAKTCLAVGSTTRRVACSSGS
ncbi:MAG TPA: hypothetical protein VMY78_13745 [Solirubrobacteraceae bacterium]|nr:hypothetical protein [Solirubrobacteraceae bacterium]